MSSVFPGMNPWLEHHADWPGFHEILIVVVVQQLKGQLRDRDYYAKPGERVWLTVPRRPTYPDVAVLRQPTTPTSARGGAATVIPDEPVRIERPLVEIQESFVEIYDAHGHQLVTGIEFISPTNKSDSQGRALYEQKQRESEAAGIHLVEIDLIRRGPSVIDVPASLLAQLGPYDYVVNLARCGGRSYEVYPIRLRNRLPRIRIPLKSGDEDAVLDLQSVFSAAWDIGPYPESLDYSVDPEPPLSAADLAWARERLGTAGGNGNATP